MTQRAVFLTDGQRRRLEWIHSAGVRGKDWPFLTGADAELERHGLVEVERYGDRVRIKATEEGHALAGGGTS